MAQRIDELSAGWLCMANRVSELEAGKRELLAALDGTMATVAGCIQAPEYVAARAAIDKATESAPAIQIASYGDTEGRIFCNICLVTPACAASDAPFLSDTGRFDLVTSSPGFTQPFGFGQAGLNETTSVSLFDLVRPSKPPGPLK
jgi:hypothetical protein